LPTERAGGESRQKGLNFTAVMGEPPLGEGGRIGEGKAGGMGREGILFGKLATKKA